MEFRALVKYTIQCHRIGYYATRQAMLKRGASLEDVAKVLTMRLRILGA